MRLIFTLFVTFLSLSATAGNECPSFLNHEYRKLHSQETINLCKLYKNKPVIIVNTASHCGYTKQFKGLEALYQTYKSEGVEVIGFASDSFRQEAKDEAKAASICYKNYGVSFTMLAPTPVKGEASNPTFKSMSQATRQPKWNFNKYLVEPSGKITAYGSGTSPLGDSLEKDLKTALKGS